MSKVSIYGKLAAGAKAVGTKALKVATAIDKTCKVIAWNMAYKELRALDKDNNVTAQEDIYYYCKDKNGGASNDSYVQEEKFDNESIINKFKEIDAEIEGIKQDLSNLHKVILELAMIVR